MLKAIKQPYSSNIKRQLIAEGSDLLRELTVRDRPGRQAFRFWQEGPGFDRNLTSSEAVLAAIDYIHLNPVKRGLCDKAVDWKWSSARRYQADGGVQEPDLSTIHRLPAMLLD